MALSLGLQQKLTQQLVMTPQLQQAIKLLQLSHLELSDALNKEMEENPVLEIAADDGDSGGADEHGATEKTFDEFDRETLGSELGITEPGGDSSGSDDYSEGHFEDGGGDLGAGDVSELFGQSSAAGDSSNGENQLSEADKKLAADLANTIAQQESHDTPEPSSREMEQDIDWDSYLDSHSCVVTQSQSGPAVGGDELPPIESTLTKADSLVDHLHFQAQMLGFDRLQLQAAILLIEEVNEDGYLAEDAIDTVLASLEELLGDELGINSDDAAAGTLPDRELVAAVLAELQCLEPIGVCQTNLRSCLLRQAGSTPDFDPLAMEIIDRFLPEVEKRAIPKLAKTLNVPIARIGEALKVISALEPRPGRAFTNREPQYITPDIYVDKVNGEWLVVQNEDSLPKLRVSGYYRSEVDNTSGETRTYIQDKLRSAQWLLRSVQMRQRTIFRVMHSILKFQEDFFERGATHLKPLILKDVADDVEMHESTISRVTTNKYVHTPQGIFELKFFFCSAVGKTDGDSVASESVRQRIEALVGSENPRKPHSDQKLVTLLRDYDIKVARRTVAKYREMLKIPSSSRRKQIF